MNEIKVVSPPGRVTIRTVAADAEVSVAAVSKVLRNAYGVSDSLRGRVQASIDRLGYRPSTAARGMRGQTYMIGILLVEIANPFIAQIVDGVNGVLAASNYKALMGMGHSASAIEASLIESMIDDRMDGLLLVAPHMSGETLAHFARQIPMVAIGHHEPSAMAFDTVNGDDQAGAAIAVRALIAKGHDDIAMIGQKARHATLASVIYHRELGYRAEMQANGLSNRIRVINFSLDAPTREQEIAVFLADPDRPRAVYVWSDLAAVPLINAAKIAGLQIPQDLAIIGYDNNNVAALPLIDLCSIDQSGPQLGALATQTLLSRIAGRTAPQHVLLEPVLITRSSI